MSDRQHCDVYWGSHGCQYERGHEGHCKCDCCDCPEDTDHPNECGCVGAYPYYGPDTRFYGEDVAERGLPDHTVPYEARPCAHCGMPKTLLEPDPCLGMLPGVVSACCGHGESDGYITFEGAGTIRFRLTEPAVKPGQADGPVESGTVRFTSDPNEATAIIRSNIRGFIACSVEEEA